MFFGICLFALFSSIIRLFVCLFRQSGTEKSIILEQVIVVPKCSYISYITYVYIYIDWILLYSHYLIGHVIDDSIK